MGVLEKLKEVYASYKSKKEVESMIYGEAKRQGFTKMRFTSHEEYKDGFSTGTWKVADDSLVLEDTGKLSVGTSLFLRLYEVYGRRPELAYRPVAFGASHERMGHMAGYTADKIAQKQLERENNYLGPPKGKDEKANRFAEIVSGRRTRIERESQANMQAVVDRMNENGMTLEKLKDEIATFIWMLYGHGDTSTGVHDSTYIKEWTMEYIHDCFPWMKGKDILKRMDEIDEQYWELVIKEENDPIKANSRRAEHEKRVKQREEMFSETYDLRLEVEHLVANPQFFI